MEVMYLFLFVFGVGFFLNAVWELLHYRLYNDLSGIAKYPHLLLATVTDGVIILGAFLVVGLIEGGFGWVGDASLWNYFVVGLVGFGVAVFIEVRALRIKRWSYKSGMPRVFGIGVSPLLQLAVTGFLSLWIVGLVFG